MKLHKRLHALAIKDIDSSEVLFEKEIYHSSLFHFQQSVEKMVKSFGLRVELIEAKDLQKKIKHLPHKVFSRYYTQEVTRLERLIRGPLLIPDMVPPHQRDKSDYHDQLNNAKGLLNKLTHPNLEENLKLDETQLIQFLKGAKNWEFELELNDEKLFNEIKDDFLKTNEHLIQYFSGDEDKIKGINLLNENCNEIVKNKLANRKENLRKQEKYKYLTYTWVNLSLILSPHERPSRYPSIENNDTPLEIYTLDNPLIKNLPKLICVFKESILKYSEIYDN